MKTEDGLTMISLVITVLIIIILAGVVIAVAINDTPINHAVDAREKLGTSQIREELELVLNEYSSECYINNEPVNIESFLMKNTGEDKYFEEYNIVDEQVVVKYKNVYFELEKNGVGYVVKNELNDYTLSNTVQNEISE